MIRRRRIIATPVIAAALVLAGAAAVAWARWTTTSVPGGAGAAAATSVEPGATPTAVADGGAVTLSWAPSGLVSGDPVAGYVVSRYDAVTLVAQSVTADCAGLITATTCTENDLTDGPWVYTVTPVIGVHWRGAASPASAPVTTAGGPPLGAAGSYSVLAGTGVVNTLATTISGDLGVNPSASITGFPPGMVAGTVHAGDAAAASAQSSLVLAYDDAAARTADAQFAGDQNGTTFDAGTYHTAAAFGLTGTLTLDGQGDPNAVFIIQVGAALTTAAASTIALINGARASHVFWQVNGAATLGAASSFAGTLMASGAITIGAGTQLIGRALCRGTVTLAGNTIRFTTALPPTIAIDGAATLETKDTTPTITGTTNAVSGTTVTITVAGQELTTTVGSSGTWGVTAAALNAGDHPVSATVRDAAGNAAIATQVLTIEVNPAPVGLHTAGAYSVLSGSTVVGTGISTLGGDLGVSPGTLYTGFPPGTVAGTINAGNAAAAQALSDLDDGYADAAGRTPSSEFAGDQNGMTYHEGVHHTAAAFTLTGTLTLDAQGDPNAIFIIQVGAALNTAAASTVALVNGAQAVNVIWQVNGAVTTGANSAFAGTIMAAAAVTVGSGTQLVGGALSDSTVTLANDTITAG